jgi:glucan biosynthesis protein C
MVSFFMSDLSRINGLDVLRGIAMVLGIFLHGAIAYKQGYHYGYWVFDDTFNSYFFDWLYQWIISFRMQLFFLLSGFFAHLLIKKIGLYEFGFNRMKRIVLPLLISYFTILPLTLLPYQYVQFSKTGDPWPQLQQFFIGFFTLRAHSGFMHLWFLQHLVLFYMAAIGLVYIFDRLKFTTGRGLLSASFRFNAFGFLIVATILIGGISQLFPAPLPSIWTGFVIPPEQLLYYGTFFIFGWILERRRDTFLSFSKYYKLFLTSGTLLSIVVLYFLNVYWKLPGFSPMHMVLKMLFAFQTMLLVIGFLGLFTQAFRKQSLFWTYIAQSAYWVYLVHLPVVMITQLVLVKTDIPGVLRFPIVILSGLFFSFITYHYMVRSTWIGQLLNGKKILTKQ